MKKILPILPAISLFAACAPPAYVPTIIHAPLLKEKGDFNGSVNTGINDFEWHAAGAITDNVGLMVSGSKTDWKHPEEDNMRKGYSFEIAPGIFKQPGKNKKEVLEVFAGIGTGYIESRMMTQRLWNNPVLESVEGNFMKYFIQPGFGVHARYADIGFHFRYTGIYFNYLRNENGDILRNSYNAFFEAAITLRVGFEYGKIVLQSGFSVATKQPQYTYIPLMSSLGVFIDIRKSYYRKSPSH